MIPKQKVLNVPVTCLPFEEQMMLILRWAKMRKSKFVCLSNVHMIMEAYWNPAFKQVLHQADLVTPDGKPLVWMLRKLGIFHQNQVAGMDVFLNLCDLVQTSETSVYFLGSTEEILDKMKQKLDQEYPILKVAGMKSIPFATADEMVKSHDRSLIAEINQSGAGIVFVCLGCPKQEVWMSHYQGLIDGVMIGVGAVFSMYAGFTPRAPHWMQTFGLEWLYRLSQEPRRLWKRYGSTIPPFLYLATKQLLTRDLSQSDCDFKQPLAKNRVNLQTLDFSPGKLGEILIKQNVLSEEQLEQALLQQVSNPSIRLGEILVQSNLISLSQLKFYLKNQNIKLGNLLVERKIVKKKVLTNVLSLQQYTTYKLGEILLENKIISQDVLNEALVEQYIRRKGLFLTETKPNFVPEAEPSLVFANQNS